jgi:transcriptional regulator with XRE-family HTH domain
MATEAKKKLDKLIGNNLKVMREERGWSQEKLAEMIDSDRRYISAVENGRSVGDGVLGRLCEVFGVEENAFTKMTSSEEAGDLFSQLPDVTRMILEELKLLPEYEQLRVLADLKEKRARRE